MDHDKNNGNNSKNEENFTIYGIELYRSVYEEHFGMFINKRQEMCLKSVMEASSDSATTNGTDSRWLLAHECAFHVCKRNNEPMPPK
jgi:hypothetical protein